jgi:PRTRC genetic system protein C
MALQVTALKREFTFQKGKETIKLTDPNPAFTPAEVAKFHATAHPELTTSTVEGPKVVGDSATYEFKTTVGTKG